MNQKTFLQTFIYCVLIAIVIAAGFIVTDPAHWPNHLLTAFIFTMAIGYSISFLYHLLDPILLRRRPILRWLGLLAVFLLGGTIGTILPFYFLHQFLGFPLQSWWLLFGANLVLSLVFGTTAVLYFSTRARAERLTEELRAREIAEEKLVRLKTEAELSALQAKVDPHFLFNTLNSIASLIAENPAAAESTVEKLSSLFRYALRHSSGMKVKLSEELEIVLSYLEIEKVRFGERLQFAIEADESLKQVEIPALLIQPLVENSIKHAIAKARDGGSIRVDVHRAGDLCRIIVRDSGQGIVELNGEGGFGLKGIRERLRIMYGERASVRISPPPTSEIQILLPLD